MEIIGSLVSMFLTLSDPQDIAVSSFDHIEIIPAFIGIIILKISKKACARAMHLDSNLKLFKAKSDD